MENNIDLIKTILSETFNNVVFVGIIDDTDSHCFTMDKDNKKHTLSVHGMALEPTDNKEAFISDFKESGIINRLLQNPGAVTIY